MIPIFVVEKKRSYGFWSFVKDIVLIGLTCGLWIIWILFREALRG